MSATECSRNNQATKVCCHASQSFPVKKFIHSKRKFCFRLKQIEPMQPEKRCKHRPQLTLTSTTDLRDVHKQAAGRPRLANQPRMTKPPLHFFHRPTCAIESCPASRQGNNSTRVGPEPVDYAVLIPHTGRPVKCPAVDKAA